MLLGQVAEHILVVTTIIMYFFVRIGYVIVIPWVVRMYMEIIHKLLASGLSDVQVDNHGITILYHLHQCRPSTSRDISC